MFDNPWVLGVGSLVFALVVFLIYWIPRHQCRSIEDGAARIALENDVRMNTAQIFGGLLALGTLILSIQEFLFNHQTEIEHQVRAQYSQDTEFFMTAVAQLGSENTTDAIAAIGAIGRIMETSENDFWPLTEVLTAFIRQEAAIQGEVRDYMNQDRKHPNYNGLKYKPNPEPRGHIEAAVHLLGRPSIAQKRNCLRQQRKKELGDTVRDDERWLGRELELRATDLSGFHLSNLDLRHANLRGANLLDSDFQHTVLVGVDAEASEWGDREPFGLRAILDDTTSFSWADIEPKPDGKPAPASAEPDSATGCGYLFESRRL